MLISINERPGGSDNADPATRTAVVRFDHGPEYPLTLRNPFSEKEEQDLEWYFEDHLRQPFLRQVKARDVAASIKTYGETLFQQVFADVDVYAQYKQAVQVNIEQLRFEISGSPEFHGWHWEALKDPKLPRACALEAPMVRKNFRPTPLAAQPRPSPILRVLIVTARPHGQRDAGYRTISRPLIEALNQTDLPIDIEILRPGTYQALADHLEQVRDRDGAGYYSVIHLDVHGAVLNHAEFQAGCAPDQFLYQARYGRPDIAYYDGERAFLFLEGKQDRQADPVEAGELAELLSTHQVPIVILNACQSGKQVGAQETSLGSRLMQAGVQLVLAMGYSITVSAAELLMRTLYAQVFSSQPLSKAIRRGRLELYNHKGRRAYFNQTVDLEDWLLPVVYQNQEVQLQLRPFTPEETQAWYSRQAANYKPPAVTYGFVGRDLDVLQIERQLLRRNLLLVQGMGGVGKTTLLHHLGYWWQTSRWVEQVFYFGYDQKAWTRQQIMFEIAMRLLGKARYYGEFEPLPPPAQQTMLSNLLRGHRHLLILDNLESITGTHFAIPNTLPPEEKTAVRDFLAALTGGKTWVLLGSRSAEEWLANTTFKDNVYELPGLDPEAASLLAERILERHKATRYRQDEGFLKLLKLLNGYPLPLEVVLANLARQTPIEILTALQAGDVALDKGDARSKTESILRCIDYSHSNLSPEAQGLLLCLAPFTGVINTQWLSQYTECLRQQSALVHLPLERWKEVLQEAINGGLLSPYSEAPDLLQPQPVFPYFLRSRLNMPVLKAAVETAFRKHYEVLAIELLRLLDSKKAEETLLGQRLTELEYENLDTVLNLGLAAQVSIGSVCAALFRYLQDTHAEQRGLALGEFVLAQMEKYPARKLSGEFKIEFATLIGTIADMQLSLKQYQAAKDSCQKVLTILDAEKAFISDQISLICANVYLQLGTGAREQRQWGEAERYYQKALAVYIKVNVTHAQAKAYQQLGNLAQEQGQWTEAEHHYQQALEIFVESDDRYEQAVTYYNLGLMAQNQQQPTNAKQYYQKALAIYIDFDERHEQAYIYLNLGNLAQEQRQWTEAEQYYQKALVIFIESNDLYDQATMYNNLGLVAQEKHEWAQAEQYCQKALAIYEKLDNPYRQATLYHNLGWVNHEQHQWAEAEKYYGKALTLFFDHDDSRQAAHTFNNLKHLWQESGNANPVTARFELLVRFIQNHIGQKGRKRTPLRGALHGNLPDRLAITLGITREEAEEMLRRLETSSSPEDTDLAEAAP